MHIDGIIAAAATPSGKGGIGIIRISGKGGLTAVSEIFKSDKLANIMNAEPNYMYFGRIDADGATDNGYMVFFKAPHSFTGEDTVELHCHGGEGILSSVLTALFKRGVYPAERGEFTKRAFLNGKLSLADAEGVIEMINAESTAALKAAYRMMSGVLSKEIYSMQNALKDIMSTLEAALDYPDETDIKIGDYTVVLCDLSARAESLINSSKKSAFIKKGVNVALIGAPNTGKSSLLNVFLKKDRAIVTDLPGTTRDTLEESFEYGGVRFNIIDTAGLRDVKSVSDIIEKKGIERSYEAVKGADMVLYVVDLNSRTEGMGESLSDGVAELKKKTLRISDIKPEIFDEKFKEIAGDAKTVVVFNKNDLVQFVGESRGSIKIGEEKYEYFCVSATEKEGTEDLLNFMTNLFVGNETESELIANSRQTAALKRANESIKTALNSCGKVGTECTLLDIREAWECLGEITGETAGSDIVDGIFERFCLGK
ncbi:MAG: tRNA uridine-5-carboxymethylaminomethyl(34) synthesis GTPase MnmE [Clostridiales bacterium]|jgi:tRNA modification GTPase|nr:tRNA uridine-5-carboxymethylaminomethyl(34) synthesis GTPase MnmE [Clostridiales bacterium]